MIKHPEQIFPVNLHKKLHKSKDVIQLTLYLFVNLHQEILIVRRK